MNTFEDDFSSADGFSVVEDHPHKKAADQADDSDPNENGPSLNHHPKRDKLIEAFKRASLNKEPSIIEVAKVCYRDDSFVGVYTDNHVPRNGIRRFYHEPIVMLDPDSIASESHELLKKDLVRFKIKMWDAEIRTKVLNRLRSLPNLKNIEIQEDDVHVMPYMQVQLMVGSTLKSIKITDEPTSYLCLSKNLDFDFECEMASVATVLAKSFKKNPELLIKKWKMELKCSGLALGNAAKSTEMMSSNMNENPTFIFKVSTLSFENRNGETRNFLTEDPFDSQLPLRLATHDEEIKDLKVRIKAMSTTSTNSAAFSIPVFSVEHCINPEAARGEYFGYSTFLMDAQTDHGELNLSSGIYTVKTAGNCQLNFNGHVYLAIGSLNHRVDLRINGKIAAVSQNRSSVETSGNQPLVISVLLPLKKGDQVGVCAFSGRLEQNATNKTRFYGILFSE